ncbi:tetratricopeptide repeat protein [Candidatus Binatia bacterium]|nr:tetratricopeptide repeat protein [Candidatus Binatia bacterium]
MRRLFAIVVGLLVVLGVVYLASVNPTHVDFHYGPVHRLEQVHVVTLLVAAFTGGVILVVLVLLLQAGWRTVAGWGPSRRERRSDRVMEWTAAGQDLVWRGDAQRGRSLLQRAWRSRPDDPSPLVALAASYREAGEVGRARALLMEKARDHHTDPDVLLALAEAQQADGDRGAAIETLERLRALHPRAARGLRALRDAYIDAGRWQDAASVHEAWIATLSDPRQMARERDHLVVLRYAAAVDLKDAPARVAAFEALAEGRVVSVPVLVGLGDALLGAGRSDEASVLWERALRAAPRTVFVERLTAMANEPAHRERIRNLLRKLRADHVQPDSVLLLLAQLSLLDGEPEEAARALEGLQSPPRHAALLHHLWGEVHRRRGALERAVAAYALVNDAPWAYRCRNCSRQSQAWVAYCPQCRGWDSYRSVAEIGRD